MINSMKWQYHISVKSITKDYDLKKIAKLVQSRIEIFPDIADHIDFFEELPEYDIAMYTHKKMKTNAETFTFGIAGDPSIIRSTGRLQQ